MKKANLFYSLTTFILCFSFISFTQKKSNKEFIGTITYSITAISKNPRILSESLTKRVGHKLVISIKNGNYRMTYDGGDIQKVYYLKSTNTEYSLRKEIDSLFMLSFDKEDRLLKGSTILDSTAVVCGRKCNILINELEDIRSIYYYDPALYLNPENYKNDKFGYANKYYEKAKSPWLKYEYQGKNLILIYTAIKVEEKELSDSTFELPKLPMKNWPK